MLISAIRQQVLALLDSVKPEARYKVLVLDARAKELIDLVCDKHDLLNRQVANVLMIDEQRPTEGYLEVVYIVEQSTFNLECIQADFTRVPRRYAAAHVFLLPRLKSSDAELQRFKNSSIARNLRRVEAPAPVSVLALEERLFSLRVPEASVVLYNAACKDLVMGLVDQTGRQLAALSAALRVNPYVRSSARWQRTRMNAYPALVAKSAAQHIADLREKYMTPQLEQDSRPTLLVLDRSVDLTGPLRHEFGFQSMALDVLPASQIKPATTLNHYTSQDGTTEGKMSGSDRVWSDLRHRHIVQVTEKLTTRIRELRAANPHFADTTTDVTVNDVRNMLAGLPEFIKERDSVTLGLDMAMECMDAVEALGLKPLAELEQTLTLGRSAPQNYEDAQGRTSTTPGSVVPESELADALVTVLAHKSAGHEAKLRALAIYAVHRRGTLRDADLQRLVRHARLDDKDAAAVRALEFLGMPIIYRGVSAEKTPADLVAESKDTQFLFARVKTGIQTVCEQYVTGKLEATEYPYAGDTPDSTEEAMTTATSLRNPKQRATWAQNVAVAGSTSPVRGASPADYDTPGSASAATAAVSKVKKKKVLIVFVVGGVTPAEAAAAYEVSDASGFSVLIGGHDFVTPSKFVNFISNISTPREQLKLEVDQPPRAVPEFLRKSDRSNERAQRQQQQQQQQLQPGQNQFQPGQLGQTGQPGVRGNSPMKGAPAPQGGARGGPTGGSMGGPGQGQGPAVTQLNQPMGQLNLSYGSQNIGGALNASGLEAPPPKEKKDIKHRLKGAFKIKR